MIFTRRFGALRARQSFQSVSVTEARERSVDTLTPESQESAPAAGGARTSADRRHAA